MTFDELKGRLDQLDERFDALNGRITGLVDSVLTLQQNMLKMLGAGSLLGAVAIYILARALGVG